MARLGPTAPAYDVTKSEDRWKDSLSREEYPTSCVRPEPTAVHWRVHRHQDCRHLSLSGLPGRTFSSDSKFDSRCGWPSFFTPLAGDSVVLLEDRSLLGRGSHRGSLREMRSHLGHVFEGEGYDTRQTSGGASTPSASLSTPSRSRSLAFVMTELVVLSPPPEVGLVTAGRA